jgi:translation initiation factor IF-2
VPREGRFRPPPPSRTGPRQKLTRPRGAPQGAAPTAARRATRRPGAGGRGQRRVRVRARVRGAQRRGPSQRGRGESAGGCGAAQGGAGRGGAGPRAPRGSCRTPPTESGVSNRLEPFESARARTRRGAPPTPRADTTRRSTTQPAHKHRGLSGRPATRARGRGGAGWDLALGAHVQARGAAPARVARPRGGGGRGVVRGAGSGGGGSGRQWWGEDRLPGWGGGREGGRGGAGWGGRGGGTGKQDVVRRGGGAGGGRGRGGGFGGRAAEVGFPLLGARKAELCSAGRASGRGHKRG